MTYWVDGMFPVPSMHPLYQLLFVLDTSLEDVYSSSRSVEDEGKTGH